MATDISQGIKLKDLEILPVLFDTRCNTTAVAHYDMFNMDDTLWTYWTNHMIKAFAIGFFLFLSCRFHPNFNGRSSNGNQSDGPQQPTKQLSSLFALGFFLFSGLGYGLTSLSSVFLVQSDTIQERVLARLSYIFLILGIASLNGEAMLYVQQDIKLFQAYILIWAMTNGAILLYVAITGMSLICGLWILLSNTFNAAVQIRLYVEVRFKACLLKALAMVFSILGLGLQDHFETPCGSSGLSSCYSACPFSNPTYFNHNALFHLLMMTSFALYGIGETIAPVHSYLDQISKNEDVKNNYVENSTAATLEV